ncbi:uncharacterized protein LOC124172686 [Ischnura elegans]|uniref:uncharacterized protein LOC124172686 n=1 Tax=Ischnura elegans TaxID=197161 RepID=UPI001ED86644|nr:uncharacterized protein LOC124172686 [Ischnura elegans]
MIRPNIEPGAYSPSAGPRSWPLLAPWALLALALVWGQCASVVVEGPIGPQRDPWRVVAVDTRSTAGEAGSKVTCPCPIYRKEAIHCSEAEAPNGRNCTCSQDSQEELQWWNNGDLETVAADYNQCLSIAKYCRFDCGEFGLYCSDGHCSCSSQDGGSYCGEEIRMQFMTAAQIALGAALVVAVMALAVLVWKMCYRGVGSSLWGVRRRGGDGGRPFLGRGAGARGSADDGSTTNSIQNFVISKMRDRPPRYEDAPPEQPPPYEQASAPTPAPLWRTTGEAPPYDDSAQASGRNASDIPEQTVAAVTDSQCSASGGASAPSRTIPDDESEGIDNSAFVREIYELHL